VQPTPTAAGRGLERWAALGGVLYVVLFVVGTIFLVGDEPSGDASPADVVRWYADSGHRDRISIGWVLVGLGLFFFLWFLAALRTTLLRLVGDGFLVTLATVGGAVYAALALAGIAVNMGIKTMSDDTYHHQVYPELIHAANDAGYVLHATGGVGIGAMMIAASLAVLRARALPVWLGWIGVVAGIIALASIIFFPWFVIALWLLGASGLLFLANSPGRASASAPAS
jgi:Domain of unknown function (DUF4386)